LKPVYERAWKTLETIGTDNNFLSRIQLAQQLRKRIKNWDYMKLKSFCRTKEMVSKLKRPPTKICTSYTSGKRLIIRIYRELKKLNYQKSQ
jgi:hypothetical protein